MRKRELRGIYHLTGIYTHEVKHDLQLRQQADLCISKKLPTFQCQYHIAGLCLELDPID